MMISRDCFHQISINSLQKINVFREMAAYFKKKNSNRSYVSRVYIMIESLSKIGGRVEKWAN